MKKKIMGRPRKDFNEDQWKLVKVLCQSQCTRDEIAARLGVSHDTLERNIKRKYGETFASFFRRESDVGFAALRAKMYQMAMQGSVTMLLHLEEKYLAKKLQNEEKENLEHVYIAELGGPKLNLENPEEDKDADLLSQNKTL